jgi:fibronectin-binding autotransporter adhesin
LTGNHNPTDITVNTSNNYVFAGSFAIATGGTLTKSGNGTLVLGINSGHSGGTSVNAGTIQVGNGGTVGSLGMGDITDNGALVFNRSDALSIGGVISGPGTLTKNGSGTLTLAATNSYGGLTTVNAGKLGILTASSGGGAYTVADGASLEVQASDTSGSLAVSSVTLGTSGSLTNNYNLGAGRFGFFPVISVSGDVNLNGTVTVNVTGSGLAPGTYVLLQYSGNLNGSGSFVAGGLPGVCTLTNDTGAKQLRMDVAVSGLVWDSGNTGNGSVIDAGSGIWDLAAGNLVWNNGFANVAFANGNNAIFSGADGAYNVTLGAPIISPIVTFANSGYTLTSGTNQTIALGSTSTGVPKLTVAAGKIAVIGTNVTVNCANTTFFGNSGDTPGGTLIITNGGVFQQTDSHTWALDGAGTIVSVQTGGLLQHNGGGGSTQLAIGANNQGHPPILSVDGGSVVFIANNCGFNIGTGASGSPVSGILTLNSGTVSMPGGTIEPLDFGLQSGNSGTLNLNGGTLSVATIVKGDPGAFATNNFNGGTLRAVNASFAATFLNGLDAANIRNGGLVFDDGGFAITIGQLLQHSIIPGDNATDGGLAKIGLGTLTLTNANTYTGTTTVSNGTLMVNGSISGNAAVVGGILGGNGTIGGSVTVAVGGAISPGTTSTDALTISSNLSLQGGALFEVNKSLSPSNNLCVVGGSLVNSGVGALTVTNLGPALQAGDSFKLFNKAVVNGGALNIVPAPGSGLAWTNKLAIDGSIAVVTGFSTASYPTNISYSVHGNTLSLSWPGTHLGWIAQSNSVNVANTNFWFDIAGSASVTNLDVTIDPTMRNVFYRIRHP